MKMYTIKNYIKSLWEWTQENENKNPIFYYFPLTSRDLAKHKDVIEWGFNNDVCAIKLLWKIVELKKQENE